MAYIEHPSAHVSDQPALIIADTGEVLTYAEMSTGANRCAQLLAQLGCETGDTIAIFSDNNLTFIELCWAAKNSGLHYACVSSHLTAAEAAYVVNNSDAKVLISAYALAETATAVAQLCDPNLQLLMCGGSILPFLAYEDMRDAQVDIPLEGRPRGASMLYSSGTTGRPKGVRATLINEPPTTPPIRHRLLVENYGYSAATVFVNPGPFYHAGPLRFMMAVHRMGGTVIGFKKFDAKSVLTAIARYGATHGFFVPTMFTRFLALAKKEPAYQQLDYSALRYVLHGAAPCLVQTKQAMMAWWGSVLYEVYGGTEGFGQTFIGPQEWLNKKGSVGRVANGCTLKIFDDNLCELPPYQHGMVYMGNGRAFEYYKDEEKTQQAFGPDDLATMGDVGYVDDEGYLFLTDRKAYVIISGGVNIYPQEVENLLSTHELVEDVAVIGVPHSEFGEAVKAVVKLKSQRVNDAEQVVIKTQLMAFCRSQLSSIKCPRSVDFVEDLPRSEAGKLLKRIIKEKYWREHTRNI